MSSESPHEDAAEATRPVAEQAETFDVEPPPGTTLFDPFRPVPIDSDRRLSIFYFSIRFSSVLLSHLSGKHTNVFK